MAPWYTLRAEGIGVENESTFPPVIFKGSLDDLDVLAGAEDRYPCDDGGHHEMDAILADSLVTVAYE
jgi:hypothetical protein